MAPWVNRAAFQRSVAQIFYHAGFEDYQPSALESVTDVATEFMKKMGQSLKLYDEQPAKTAEAPRFTFEEQVLHTLDENGLDIEGLETYIRDDVERLSTKLGVVHERMKSHLADLLVSYMLHLLMRHQANKLAATCFGRSCRCRWRWSLQRWQRTIRRRRLC